MRILAILAATLLLGACGAETGDTALRTCAFDDCEPFAWPGTRDLAEELAGGATPAEGGPDRSLAGSGGLAGGLAAGGGSLGGLSCETCESVTCANEIVACGDEVPCWCAWACVLDCWADLGGCDEDDPDFLRYQADSYRQRAADDGIVCR